ncbi:LysR family transcriptional regulator [Asaia lannensis]|uniref:LysR family transcriptional regulator n=1 Tax=Asaia lannensis TaxID=415421 RepID=UPI003872C2E6
MAEQYDLNLLYALHMLLEEGSVSGAARRLRLSSATVSRTLARIRTTFNDPILVASGRKMVLTPRAAELQPLVDELLANARSIAQRRVLPDLKQLAPSLTIRANDAVMSAFGGAILATLRRDCPNCHIRFAPEWNIDEAEALRSGELDLYIGATRTMAAEIRRQTLFTTRVLGIARTNHPLFDDHLSIAALCRYDHLVVSRRGRRSGPIDEALQEAGHQRNVAAVVPTYAAALDMIKGSDVIMAVPEFLMSSDEARAKSLRPFIFPVALNEIEFFQAWHPRFEADPVRRWLRQTIRAVITLKGQSR